MSVPEIGDEARRAALVKAKQARQDRAALKVALKAGEVSLAEVLDAADRNAVVAKMRTVEVLESLPGVGKVTAGQLMDELAIADSRRLRGLGSRQRAALLERFATDS
jgi:hypothetical protein